MNTAGQAFSQFTVIFIDLNSSFSVCGNALIQSQSIGRLLFTQKICCVRMDFRFFDTLINCCWLICRLMAIISWLPNCLLS
ncbi:Uncharacterised protein [Klebsiella pneumoniae]|nr:Uncharacterised protein [Klebsiella pneumoniae]